MSIEFGRGEIEIDEDDLHIFYGSRRVTIPRERLREFFAAVEEARDEVMPPGPLDIPDPMRHEEIFIRVNEAQKAPFDPREVKGALGQLACAVGNVIQRHREAS